MYAPLVNGEEDCSFSTGSILLLSKFRGMFFLCDSTPGHEEWMWIDCTQSREGVLYRRLLFEPQAAQRCQRLR